MREKNVELKITGKQFDASEEETVMEFISEGTLTMDDDGVITLVYPESEVSGFEGCTTTLRIDHDDVNMERRGEDDQVKAELHFKEGGRIDSPYETPYGMLTLEVLTESIKHEFDDNGMGSIRIAYRVSLGGVAEGKNELMIEVQEVWDERKA